MTHPSTDFVSLRWHWGCSEWRGCSRWHPVLIFQLTLLLVKHEWGDCVAAWGGQAPKGLGAGPAVAVLSLDIYPGGEKEDRACDCLDERLDSKWPLAGPGVTHPHHVTKSPDWHFHRTLTSFYWSKSGIEAGIFLFWKPLQVTELGGWQLPAPELAVELTSWSKPQKTTSDSRLARASLHRLQHSVREALSSLYCHHIDIRSESVSYAWLSVIQVNRADILFCLRNWYRKCWVFNEPLNQSLEDPS